MNDQERGEQELIGKNVAFYQTFLSAWVENRMETDKQLLTLSSLAIGLLMVVYDKLNTVLEFLLWVASGVAFLLSIAIIISIFKSNGDYIEQLIRSDNPEKIEILEKTLRGKTTVVSYIFFAGILLAFFLLIIKSGFVVVKI